METAFGFPDLGYDVSIRNLKYGFQDMEFRFLRTYFIIPPPTHTQLLAVDDPVLLVVSGADRRHHDRQLRRVQHGDPSAAEAERAQRQARGEALRAEDSAPRRRRCGHPPGTHLGLRHIRRRQGHCRLSVFILHIQLVSRPVHLHILLRDEERSKGSLEEEMDGSD